MTTIVALFVVIYACVNGFGAWMVLRRKPWVGWLFMLSAIVLVVAAVSVFYQSSASIGLTLSGLILAFCSSLLHAHFVIGKVVQRNHLFRLLSSFILFLLVYFLG